MTRQVMVVVIGEVLRVGSSSSVAMKEIKAN